MNQIGITTTIPTEVLLAAGATAVDLNNVFITSKNPCKLIDIAEKDGFPLNCCAWIKGVYGACKEYDIKKVICVTTGDCSNTEMLMEVLRLKGIEAFPFSYPPRPDKKLMENSLRALADSLGTTLTDAEKFRTKLADTRGKAHLLDSMTHKEGKISGFDNHYWLVSTSDFNRDYQKYNKEIEQVIQKTNNAKSYPQDMLRLAYIGVPPVFGTELYPYFEKHGARVVFNEIQRQFSMPKSGANLPEQYCNYTYPYSTKERIDDIKRQIEEREIDAVIHYVQAFCHRAISDIIFRRELSLPILTIEGNNEFTLSQHLKTRIEAFIDMAQIKRELSMKKNRRQ